MPFQIKFDAPILHNTLSGYVTKAEFIEFASELKRVEQEFERVPDRLTDLSDVKEWEPDFGATFEVAYRRRAEVFPNKFRSAIVAPNPGLFGIARMFQSLNECEQIEIRVFKTKAEAERWLASNE
jgi:hypothetical protein